MSHTNTRIYIDTTTDPDTGVSIEDIRQVLGLGNYDIGGLITQGVAQDKINKWAKYKPIHYPGKYKLDEADFRGRTIDTSDHGLVYGLKVPSQTSVINPSAFHATTWDYDGYPNATGLTGTSMYRILDFDGYNSQAVANIYGLIPDSSRFYVGTTRAISTGASVVNEAYRQNESDGVDLARYVVDGMNLTDDELMARLAQSYPAILVGNYLTGVGVYNSTTDSVDYNTVVRSNGSGGWVVSNPNWCVDMTKTVKPVTGVEYQPWTATTSETATLVFVYTASQYPRLVNGDSTTDLTQNWFDLTEERAWTARIFPLPGGTGVPVAIVRYAVGYTVTPISATATSSTVTVNFSVSFEGSTQANGRVDISANVGTGGTAATAFRILIPSGTSLSVTFNASDFGIPQFIPGTNTEISVSTTARADGSTDVNTASATLTITY